MSNQTITAPAPEDIDYIARMLIAAQNQVKATIDQDLEWSLQGLTQLQATLDQQTISASETYTLQSLGAAFGKIFVENNQGYDWWMVEDQHGHDVCLRYRETDLLIFPQTMISKRIEDGETVNLQDMYDGLGQMLADIIKTSYPGQ